MIPSSLGTVLEPAREIPVEAEADIVVVGGGPSGFIAATAAARGGARTMLIEHHSFLGGMATAGLVGPISKFNMNGQRVVRGLPEEFINRLARHGGALIDFPSGNVPFDAELYKQVAHELAVEAGAVIRLRAQYTGVAMDSDGKATHLFMQTRAGRSALRTRFVIDCTGSADVVRDAGLPWTFRAGPEGELQPLSLMFRLGGVSAPLKQTPLMSEDDTRYFHREARQALEEAVAQGRLKQFGGPWLIYGSTFRAGELTVNATRYGGNAVAPGDFSDAEACLRRDMSTILDILRQRLPELRDAYLLESAPQAGIRETRAICGEYTLTAEDILSARPFDDTVAFGAHPLDLHRAATAAQEVKFVGRAYPIPYRTLVPRASKNLLVAGGSLSATREAFASVRVQAQCMALGQAAGTAAALCLRLGIDAHHLNGTLLREELRKAGACVDQPA